MTGFVFLILVVVAFVQAIHIFLPVKQYVGLLSDITSRFQAGCLFLVHTESLGVQETSKLLARKGVHASCLHPRDLNKTSNSFTCKRNRPIYVLHSDEATRAHVKLMRKMGSYPRWLIFLDESQTIDDFFLDIHVPFNCEVLIVQTLGPGIQLTEVYQVAEHFPLRKRHFGTWTAETGLTATALSLYQRRNDLEGLVMTAISLNMIDAGTSYPVDVTERMNMEGIYLLIWRFLERLLNFSTVSAVEAHGKISQESLKNGMFNYMVSLVAENKVHAAINGFAYQKERMDIVDFVAPIQQTRVVLMVRKPTSVRFQWSSFLAPFACSLWLGVFGTLTLCGALLTLSYQTSQRQGFEERRVGNEFHLLNSLFHVLGLYCSQGCPFEPRAVSSRIVLLLAGLTSTVVVAAYSGALTSFMTVQKLDLPYETIQEYVQDSDYEIEMSPNAFFLYVNNSRDAMFRGLYHRLVNRLHEMPISRWNGAKKLCASRNPFAWVGSFSFGASFLSELSCEIVSVPDYFSKDFDSYILPKGSPYKKLFDHNLAAMRAMGVLKKIFLLASPPPLVNADSSVKGLELYQVVPIFCVVLAGILLSMLLVLAELAKRRP